MKKTTKEIYSQPTFKLLVIRFEKNLLTLSNNVNGDNHTQYLDGGDDDDYYEEL